MPSKQQVLSTLKNLEADDKVWVAGSAAIIPELAGDIDVWVLKKSSLTPSKFSLDMWTEDEENPNYAHIPVTKRLSLTVPSGSWGSELKVQVMFLEMKQIFELLNLFDVSCHAWARNHDGYLVMHPEATLPGQPIQWINPSSRDGGPVWEGPDEDKIWEDGLCPKDSHCSDCDQSWAKIESGTYKLIVQPESRLAKFTERYANTTPSMCWLPT